MIFNNIYILLFSLLLCMVVVLSITQNRNVYEQLLNKQHLNYNMPTRAGGRIIKGGHTYMDDDINALSVYGYNKGFTRDHKNREYTDDNIMHNRPYNVQIPPNRVF